MKSILLISTSLSKESISANLIKFVNSQLKKENVKSKIIDLREFNIPFCDGRSINEYDSNIQSLFNDLKNIDYIIFGFPIYCYSISGVLKNFLDIFSLAMRNKRFGVCASAGSKMSYLAISDLFKIMKFQSNAIGIMPTVLVNRSDFQNNIPNEEIKMLINEMLSSLLK